MSRSKMATNWNDLSEEVKVPAEVAMAFAANRPELPTLAARDMSKEEVKGLIDAIRVLMDTNSQLQTRCVQLAQQADNIRGSLTGLEKNLDSLRRFAEFKEDEED